MHDDVREEGGTARQAWVAIEAKFLGNRQVRILHLDTAFRGNLNIIEVKLFVIVVVC
jgi:primosomal replication protein N